MGKLEKLKEINKTIKDLLVELETRIFLENIDVDNIKKVKEVESNGFAKIK